jgi:hypothetical protein
MGTTESLLPLLLPCRKLYVILNQGELQPHSVPTWYEGSRDAASKDEERR